MLGGVSYHGVDVGRALVQCRHRWHDDSTHFRHADHVAKMSQIQRSFSRQQDQAASLFQHNIRGTGNQVVRQAVRHSSQSVHGAGRNHHAHGRVGATGDAVAHLFG